MMNRDNIDLGTFDVSVKMQLNGKYDIYISHAGSSGEHYTDVTADRIGEILAVDIECIAEGYLKELIQLNQHELLKQTIINAGIDAVKDFLGYIPDEDCDIGDAIDDAADQMPDDIYQNFIDKYC